MSYKYGFTQPHIEIFEGLKFLANNINKLNLERNKREKSSTYFTDTWLDEQTIHFDNLIDYLYFFINFNDTDLEKLNDNLLSRMSDEHLCYICYILNTQKTYIKKENKHILSPVYKNFIDANQGIIDYKIEKLTINQYTKRLKKFNYIFNKFILSKYKKYSIEIYSKIKSKKKFCS